MAANNDKTAFRLFSRVKKGFMSNLLWPNQQQQQQKNTNQQQQQDINQFTSPPPTALISEKSSGNVFVETEENDYDQQNVG